MSELKDSSTSGKQGIGPNGITLKALLHDSRQKLSATGCYQGLTELSLKKQDPIKFERFHARLLSTVISVRDTMKFIASSPAVRDFEEFLINLYTPEGDSVVISTGIMVHVHTLSEFIKFIIENDYEVDPGIKDGDIFANNELWAGGVHTPDVQTVIPLFYGDTLVGWVGAVSHELETGTYEGGGMTIFSPERYGEGLHISAEKVGENDRFYSGYVRRIQMNTRNPVWWIMDDRSKLAGCIMVREAVRRLIDEVGLDYYLQAVKEIIEEARLNFLARVKRTLVPGRYMGVNVGAFKFKDVPFQHPLGKKDTANITPIEVHIKDDGRIFIDLDGAGEWGFHPFNCGPGAMGGGLWITLTQMLAYDGKVNDGAYYAVEQNLPLGTVVNATYPGAGSSIAWATLIPIYSNLARLLSMGFYARGFLEEVFQGTPNALMNGAGISQFGGPIGVSNFELTASGSGARAIADGIDCGHSIWNPEATQGDIEVWEMAVPKLYLSRNFVADRHGFGKYRGGASWGSLWIIHGSQTFYATLSAQNSSGTPMLSGLFGGYPAPAVRILWAQNTNIFELISQRKTLPVGIDQAVDMLSSGYIKASQWHCIQQPAWTDILKDGDIFAIEYPSGSGFGDPLERDVELVLRDVENGIHTLEGARRFYGVILEEKDGRLQINIEGTEKERTNLRKQRLARSVPVKEWWRKRRDELAKGGNINPILAAAYRSSASMSDIFAERFDRFWKLARFPFGEAEA